MRRGDSSQMLDLVMLSGFIVVCVNNGNFPLYSKDNDHEAAKTDHGHKMQLAWEQAWANEDQLLDQVSSQSHCQSTWTERAVLA